MFDFSPDAGLWGLAAAAFLSATVLPGNSEIVLISVLAKFPTLFWQCIVVATVANTLGNDFLLHRPRSPREAGKK